MTLRSEKIAASNTWQEIHRQPDIWRRWAATLDIRGLRQWVSDLDVVEVWFCGAGTSAYIGDIIAAGLSPQSGKRFRSIPSTDIVARPNHFLSGMDRTLIVNFGRSGDSTETVGTLRAVKMLAPGLPMLNVTCNPNGALANSDLGKVVVLPEECHDAGFAMTSSFSTMLLTALAIFDDHGNGAEMMKRLADNAAESLSGLAEQVGAAAMPARAVYVGSGSMAFAARESALKVMELSAGQIPALWDSTLGFRHGPKSFVQNATAIHVLLSSDPEAAPYDQDLVDELRVQFPDAVVRTIGPEGDLEVAGLGNDSWDAVLAVLPAQLQSVIWSSELGLNIDDPFVGKSTLSRVVSGVRLHPVEPR